MISVVIATKDRAEFLQRALDSLELQQAAPAFEVVVVDNGSRDTTAQLVRERGRATPFALRYVFVARPNRGAARNAGIAAAMGELVAFVDDDVWLPAEFLAAHAAAHRRAAGAAVSGPILNVPSYAERPKPKWTNYSGAFFCTCNVSVSRAALLAAGGFDEGFDLYGWEDTELGLRLRRAGVRRAFAWNAYLWHVKLPQSETLDVVLTKTTERARMAARLLAKEPGWRTRLATGAYRANMLRARLVAPAWSLPWYRALAENAALARPLRAFARAQLLDGAYATTLHGALMHRTSSQGAPSESAR